MARRTSRRWIALASSVWLLLSMCAGALSQQGLLVADPRPLSSSARSNAPIPLVWQLNYQGTGLLKGHLDVAMVDGNELLAQVRVSDLVLTAGQTEIVTMLPPVASTNQVDNLTLRVRFTQAEGRLDLGRFQIRTPGAWQSSLVACICAPDLRVATAGQNELSENVRLDQFYSSLKDRRLVTNRATVLPAEMPDDPLFYCGFDLVVLTPEGLVDLQEKQLQAISAWVAAGGSLLVVPARTLEPEHLQFLNELFRSDPDDSPFLLDAQGRLVLSESGTDPEASDAMQVRTARVGLGRAAAVSATALDAIDFGSQQWRGLVAFLWKVRRQQLQAVTDTGVWDVKQMLEAARIEQQDGQYNQYADMTDEEKVDTVLFAYEPIQTVDQLLRQLMPSSVQVISGWLIAGVLVLYILVIGPGDYWFLGLLNRRKWTWVLFPAVTLAFTLFAMWLSQVYMGTTDLKKSAVFFDIGDDGRVVRSNRFELVFAGARQQVNTEVRRGMFTPLNHLAFGSGYYYSNNNGGQTALVDSASYSGRMPFLYTASQDVPQWTPQLNRVLNIAPEVEMPQVDWSEFDVSSKAKRQARDTLIARLQQVFGSDALVRIYNGDVAEELIGGSSYFDQNYSVYNPQLGISTTTDFIKDTSVRTARGMLAMLSQIAPTGGPSFEDMPLLDSTDRRQWLLVVVVPRADELVIYRKLYTLPTGVEPEPLVREPVEAPKPSDEFEDLE